MQKLSKYLLISLLFLHVLPAFALSTSSKIAVHYVAKLDPLANDAPSNAKKVWRAIKSKSLLLNAKEKTASSSSNLLLLANSEYSNILAILQDYGYFGAVISIKLNGQEVHNINSNINLANQNSIEISIDTGPIYRLDNIVIKGALPQTKIPLKPGDTAEASVIKQISINAVKDLQNEGFATASIANQKIIANDQTRLIDFFLILTKGQKIYLNNLTIINATKYPSLKKSDIARFSGFTAGSLLTPKLLDQYRENLEQLDLFSSIMLNQTIIPHSNLANLTLIINEKPKHNFSSGINYDTKNGAGANISWLHRNLTGRGDHLTLKASIASLYSPGGAQKHIEQKNKHAYNYDYSLQYDIPGILSYNGHAALNLRSLSEHTTYYDSKSLEAKFGFYKILSDKWLGSSYFTIAGLTDDSRFYHNRSFHLFGLDNSLGFDLRDDTLEPHKGYLLNMRLNPFYETRDSHLWARIELEGRTYWALNKDEDYILALRGQYNTIVGTNLKNIPSSMQYYAGGGDNLRGFRYRSIGLPIYISQDHTQSAIGGLSMALFSAELRAHIKGNFGAVAFIDNAILGSSAVPKNISKTGVGVGIRYKSPIGPVRLDVATPLKRNKNDGKFQLYIGIGEAF